MKILDSKQLHCCYNFRSEFTHFPAGRPLMRSVSIEQHRDGGDGASVGNEQVQESIGPGVGGA